jgi:hypothetical protein
MFALIVITWLQIPAVVGWFVWAFHDRLPPR